MKTSEFIHQASKIGFRAGVNEMGYVCVLSKDSDDPNWFICIGKGATGDLSIDSIYLENQGEDFAKVMKLAIDYAFTPLAEREDEPKFRVKIFPESEITSASFLNKDGSLNNGTPDDSVFTCNEYFCFIAEHPRLAPFLHDYDPDNTDVFVPVEEDE
ncbi:hypothetical protein HC026_11010 [Lactobacillus sp. LC28-10]|uniref:Uncharacterized protein n=1 Tax=Secundilactobacillus angelensis TaxID=2722706 RepID=A0ABX1KZR0_9LACO|nr:hypothetical protein [Secundilactobacillus angelensis]MCH5463219.1 hypothetical protein [Secundilactobacillus angelensis]NLR19422.1 hypothetical protein [Secundilactobacillus angelensis]